MITSRRRAAALLAAVFVAGTAGPAAAHRLKLFVASEVGEITGYGFFVGGGRPDGVEVVVEDAAGHTVHRGRTDEHGGFRWRPPVAADYVVSIDTGDGHRATAGITADRLAGANAAAPPPPPVEPTPVVLSAEMPVAAPIDRDALARLVEARVDAALERRLRPLMEAYDQAESRLRFNDVMGGVGMIAGLAGAALWATARRRAERGEKGEIT